MWMSYLGHRDLVSISPQVTQHLGSQNSLLLVADSSGRDWMSPEDLLWNQARLEDMDGQQSAAGPAGSVLRGLGLTQTWPAPF